MAGSDVEIGSLLRKAREERGMTQQALADAIGCSKAQLSLMESGSRKISPARAHRIGFGLYDGVGRRDNDAKLESIAKSISHKWSSEPGSAVYSRSRSEASVAVSGRWYWQGDYG